MHGILKRLASLWVLTNKTCLHQRKPSATFRSHVLRGQFALPNPTGTGKDGMNHYCHLGISFSARRRLAESDILREKLTLAYTRYTETRPPEMISDWSPPTNMEVCLQYFCFLSEEFTSHSQHRHADNAPTIPMSRPNVRAHRRRLVTACHACETIF